MFLQSSAYLGLRKIFGRKLSYWKFRENLLESDVFAFQHCTVTVFKCTSSIIGLKTDNGGWSESSDIVTVDLNLDVNDV